MAFIGVWLGGGSTGLSAEYGRGGSLRCVDWVTRKDGSNGRCVMMSGKTESSAIDLETIKVQLDSQRDTAFKRLEETESLQELQDIRVEYLGKKGSVTSTLKLVGRLPKDDRPKVGAMVNAIKAELEEKIEQAKLVLEEKEMDALIVDDQWDMTIPGTWPKAGRIHPIRATIQKIVDIFVSLGYDLVDGPEMSPEIETDYYCFEALNCPEDHPARDMQDTLYVTEDMKNLMRTQTSAVQARYLEKYGPPFAIVCPGRVFRRDDIDATHSFQFHQVEIMALGKDINLGNLRATMIHFLKELFGDDIKVRFRSSYFPFTEPSMEVDLFFRGEWMEVLGCGMVDPAVLEKAGYDPEEWCGFAAGFGVERFAMVLHQIQDIREFTNNNYEFLDQFNFRDLPN
uniref:Phenylalanine--tRNA ligase alpha subunit n=1 Tax=Timspurckia oligopyrenoides TaxID=708627 RepID=A0A7S1EUL2_9RHOD|mmetsp:Transcript_9917/g.17863  ORF Transcript_9917/g.17863 Transcript_9917/m.17863 type:complete len:398 (+) Transcript_9917:36-1229(+)